MMADGSLGQHVTMEALDRVVSPAAGAAALAATGRREQRQRALPCRAVVWALLAMNLPTDVGLSHVLRQATRGLRFIAPDPDAPLPTASALTYRRYQAAWRRWWNCSTRSAARWPPRPRRAPSASACG